MSPDHFERVEALFHRLKPLSQREREEALGALSSEEAEVVGEVRRLLRHPDTPAELQRLRLHAEGLVESTLDFAADGVASSVFTPEPLSGTRIGPYAIIRTLGEGGMGAVYLAEQTQPVRRQVALKLIKPGMDTRAVLARFEAERQALALMSHPNIATVHDAGTTAQGRPYFVMEYVPGVPVTEYRDQRRLTVRQRLELFTLVCDAVQHAHQKGVMHRDLKPGNVLVAEQDGKAILKVIDFGIAKATGDRLTSQTLVTAAGQFLGTLGYMSPEQAGAVAIDVDTRTDVYSLGVLLYEVLVGAPPFDLRRLQEAGFAEAQRIIREDEPPKPSTRLSSAPSAATTVAQQRGTEPRTLLRQVRSDLDWIVMRCLEKDRARRYASASELAADLHRYLRQEPVLAGPPSAGYRLRKFVRRNRLVVSVSSVALLGGAIATLLVLQSARQARLALSRLQIVDDFMDRALRAPIETESIEGSMTMVDFLQEVERVLDSRPPEDPLVESQICRRVGSTYSVLGDYERAEHHLGRARELAAQAAGAEDAFTLEVRLDFAENLAQVGRYGEALTQLQPLLETCVRLLGASAPLTLEARRTLAIARLNNFESETTPADEVRTPESLLLENLDAQERALGANHTDLAYTLNELGQVAHLAVQNRRAEEYAKRAYDLLSRHLGPRHKDTLTVKLNWVNYIRAQGREKEALPLLREIAIEFEEVFGSHHPYVTSAFFVLAEALYDSGIYDPGEVISLSDRAAAETGRDQDLRCQAMNLCGKVYRKLNRHDLAAPKFHAAAAIARQLRGFDPVVALLESYEAGARRESGDFLTARSLADATDKECRSSKHKDHVWCLAARLELCQVLQKLDRHVEGVECLESLTGNGSSLMSQEPWFAATVLTAQADSDLSDYQIADAEAKFVLAFELMAAAHGPGSVSTNETLDRLQLFYVQRGLHERVAELCDWAP